MAAEGMSWDWRGQPDIDELDRIVSNMSLNGAVRRGAMLRIHAADTGADEYGIVITDELLTQKQVNERWMAWWRRG
ncbi:hypothetical protein Drose_04370 [Dactylosporangium roseum]|uniref:Uncharacterized protein n=1 Tax=Dactylosporangium roseum TaxID=47989 RepID=A0ABY5Z640_9ACTN|nr:hypothetical protein [Dactylosporangium roseum]UWZ37525.1 hypothetical protein Drose_04370 [Dactylosporangium roseum]